LFDSTSLDKAFILALAIKRKVATQTKSGSSPSSPSNVALTSSPWCTFHKTNSHFSTNCHVLQNMHPQKTHFTEVEQPNSSTSLVVVSLDNPTEIDPSLILMIANEVGTFITPLFTHNYQIRNELVNLILDNGSQNNFVA